MKNNYNEMDLILDAKSTIMDHIFLHYNTVPETVIVLGSGLGVFKNNINIKETIPYDCIPGFKGSSVEGHSNTLIIGAVSGKPIIAMNGRFHYYEGYSMQEVTFPIKVFAKFGVKNLILSAAVGSVSDNLKPCDIMVINDHIKFFDENPLRGANNSELGTRFPDMTNIYQSLKTEKLKPVYEYITNDLGLEYKEGIYAFMPGPSYETPAEIRALKILGANVVGMSTVPEAIVSNYCGLNTIAFAAISNYAAGIIDQPLNHEEVIENGKIIGETFSKIVTKVIETL